MGPQLQIDFYFFFLGSYFHATGIPLPPGPRHARSLLDKSARWLGAGISLLDNLSLYIFFRIWGGISNSPGRTEPRPLSHAGDTHHTHFQRLNNSCRTAKFPSWGTRGATAARSGALPMPGMANTETVMVPAPRREDAAAPADRSRFMALPY